MSTVHVARAFRDRAGLRYLVDGVSTASGRVVLLCGTEQSAVDPAELVRRLREDGWVAEEHTFAAPTPRSFR